jgi:hypothetical protein
MAKTLVMDQNLDAPQLPNKVESAIVMQPNLLLLINDNDFGIAGDHTTFTYVGLSPHSTN